MARVLRLVSKDGAAGGAGGFARPTPLSPASDEELLDAYSKAVIRAAEEVAPAVVKIDVTHSRPGRESADARRRPGVQGNGSGFLFTCDRSQSSGPSRSSGHRLSTTLARAG